MLGCTLCMDAVIVVVTCHLSLVTCHYSSCHYVTMDAIILFIFFLLLLICRTQKCKIITNKRRPSLCWDALCVWM